MTDRDALLALGNLTGPQRQQRLHALVLESRAILSAAIQDHITDDRRRLAAVVLLFSGGNDSTTLAHLFRSEATHAAHANTTIGIEETRQFVRNTCEEWGLPLIERSAPRATDHYRTLVLGHGFPGPAHHFKMYQRLKERALRSIRNELVSDPRRERIVFLAGRRRDESERRSGIPTVERTGSIVWVSPLVNWTKMDLNTYRLVNRDVPTNRVSDLIHMSGECLCGSFAAPGERAEIDYWFPLALDEVREMEAALAPRADIPEHRKTWGWGADPALKGKEKPSRSGQACGSCAGRFEQLPLEGVA